MKRLAVITTSLFLLLTPLGGTAAAFADKATQTYYPEDFNKPLVFTDLKNYDIEGNGYYFLDGEDCLKFENGELTDEPHDNFSEALTETTVSNRYNYYFDDAGSQEGELKVHDRSTDATKLFEGNFGNLKKFGDKAYAVKDNVLYRFEGTDDPEAIQPVYLDYSETKSIAIGMASENLKNYQGLTFVNIKKGSFMTAIDLGQLDGDCFKLEHEDNDIKVNTVKTEDETAALLLCYTGNAAIVSIGYSSYILHENCVEAISDTSEYVKNAEFTRATITGDRIYASPFTVAGTTLLSFTSATSRVIDVKGKIEFDGVLNSVYYEVEYGPDDARKTGYVADGLLTAFIIEDNKEPSVIPDPEHSESNSTTTVLLILAVVILVLAAIGYLVYVSTTDKHKKKNKNTEEEKTEDKQ